MTPPTDSIRLQTSAGAPGTVNAGAVTPDAVTTGTVATPPSATGPLSYPQERIWFLQEHTPEAGRFNVTLSYRLTGFLDTTALKRALNELVRRHASLRTKFHTVDGQVQQTVCDATPMALTFADFSKTDAERDLEALLTAERDIPFDLHAPPLVRATVARLTDQTSQLVITIHHLAWDFWSGGIIHTELSALYRAFSEGLSHNLAQPEQQYIDFARAQRLRFADENCQESIAYWKRKLADLKPNQRLYGRRSRPDIKPGCDGSKTVTLSSELTEQLTALSKKSGVTLYMTLLASLKLVLMRLSGETDIAVGSPVANRDKVEFEGIIGAFINTVILRTNIEPGSTFQELLKNVRDTAFEGFRHQSLPFEKVVQEANPERDLGGNPFVNVMFNFRNVPVAPLTLAGLEVEQMPRRDHAFKLLLSFYVTKVGSGLSLNLTYEESLYDGEAAQLVLETYQQVLAEIVLDPSITLSSSRLIPESYRRFLPDLTRAIPRHNFAPVIETFQSIASAQPHLVALREGADCRSYGELSARATAVARLLLKNGARSGDTVAVVGPSNASAISAILGTMMAGGVLVLLDPALPASRLDTLITETKAKFVLVPAGNSYTLEQQLPTSITIIGLASLLDARQSEDSQPALPAVTADQPAYIFFTSGSTGTPNAVQGTHAGLAHFVHWQRTQFGIDENDRVAQLAKFSFDAILRDIFTPLTSGASVCLPPQDIAIGGTKALSWMQEAGVTIVHTVPSLASSWLHESQALPVNSSLRLIFFSGEPLKSHIISDWRRLLRAEARFVNLYGPTETTMVKSFYEIPADPKQHNLRCVGKPFPDTEIFAMTGGELCSPGQVGELVIRTPYRTQGYINNQELQQKRFRRNPLRSDEEDLFYHTGDLGCLCLDGSIELFGRQDEEVKVRGQRVNPSEIQNLVARHASVHDCALRVAERDGDKSFIAYVVPRAGCEFDANALREHMRSLVPPGLVPRFVAIDRIPVTHNGKVDLKALCELPAEKAVAAAKTGPGSMPQTELEHALHAIWCDLLDRREIGVDDDFFDAGGHSLLVVRLLLQVDMKLQLQLPVTAFFEHSTIRSLANFIQSEQSKQQAAAFAAYDYKYIAQLQASGSKPPVFLVCGGFAAEGEMVTYSNVVRNLSNEYPVYAFKSRNADGVSDPHMDVAVMAADYIEEMRQLQPVGPYYILGSCIGAAAAFEIACQLQDAGQEIAMLALFDGVFTNAARNLKMGFMRAYTSKYMRELPEILNEKIQACKDEVKQVGRRKIPEIVGKQLVELADELAALLVINTKDFILTKEQRQQLEYQKTLKRYRPKRKFRGNMTLLLTEEFRKGGVERLWQRWVDGEIEIGPLPGTHFSHVREDAADTGRALNEHIEKAQRQYFL